MYNEIKLSKIIKRRNDLEKQLSKELRLLGITREEAAKKIGVSTATLSNWVNGNWNISPVGVRLLEEMGVTKRAIKDPSKDV